MRKTMAEIQRTGYETLAREMGVVGMIRFLQLFEQGDGDYTAERDEIVLRETDTVESIAAAIQARKDVIIPR